MKFSLPPLTRACVIAFIILSTCTMTLRYMAFSRIYQGEMEKPVEEDKPRVVPQFQDMFVPYLTLVPSISIIYPWTLATSSFIEQALFGSLISGATFVLGGRYLERVWSSRELAIFIAIQCIIPNLVTALVLTIMFAITRNEWLLVNVVSGGGGIQAGFLVAFKQLVPEHAIVLFQGAFRVHVKHLVIPTLLSYSVLGLIVRHPVMVILPWTGFFTAWIYLRFYRVTYVDSLLPAGGVPSGDSLTSGTTDQTKIRGDASDTFALADFFYPDPVKQVVAAVSNTVFDVLVSVGICAGFNDDEVDASNLRASIRTGSEAGAAGGAQDAERRRALALKVLEERLQQS